MKWSGGTDWPRFQLMFLITMVVGSFCQGSALQKAKEPLPTPGTQLTANIGHPEQGNPAAVTWGALVLTGSDKHMYMLGYALRFTCWITPVCPRELSNTRQGSA